MKPSISFLALLLLLSVSVFARAGDWTTNYKAALDQAKAQNKLVLLDFTGSDWCGFCQLLDKEVFTQPEFHHYADQTFILVTIDYPHGTQLPDDLKQQNAALKLQYRPDGFPTLVVVDSDGKELGRKVGYHPGSGPQVVIDALKKISKN